MPEPRNYGEFMAVIEKTDPERFAAVASKYPVKTRRQLEYVRTVEVSAGLIEDGYAFSGLETSD